MKTEVQGHLRDGGRGAVDGQDTTRLLVLGRTENENICMTFEEAITNKELRKALKPYKGGCDVIVSE